MAAAVFSDASRIAVEVWDGKSQQIWVVDAGEVVPTDVSRDGTLLFSLGDQTAERAIWRLSLDDLSAKEILQTAAQEHHAMFSPGALDCLCIERIWPTGDLRPAIPHRPGNRATCIRRGRRWARLGAG